MTAPYEVGQLRLQSFHFRPPHIASATQDFENRGLHLTGDFSELTVQIQ